MLFFGVNQIDSHFRECKLLHIVLSFALQDGGRIVLFTDF